MSGAAAIAAGGRVSGSPHLLNPFAIGRVALQNRVVFQPHFTASNGFSPNTLMTRSWEEAEAAFLKEDELFNAATESGFEFLAPDSR
ncbi:MAG: hypothetical protein QHC90_10665 [Shinella sp.]|nr:hypothetical protein [Shinella sp.]